jgi:hypothetical protein
MRSMVEGFYEVGKRPLHRAPRGPPPPEIRGRNVLDLFPPLCHTGSLPESARSPGARQGKPLSLARSGTAGAKSSGSIGARTVEERIGSGPAGAPQGPPPEGTPEMASCHRPFQGPRTGGSSPDQKLSTRSKATKSSAPGARGRTRRPLFLSGNGGIAARSKTPLPPRGEGGAQAEGLGG